MERLQINQKLNLTIDNIGHNGEGIGRINGFTVFVDGALPGEIVNVRLTECHKRYGRADILSIIKTSPNRVAPPCSIFGKCGGCQLMHLAYKEQLKVKQQRVIDAFQRIGKFVNPPVAACQPSPSALTYRNKMQLPTKAAKDGLAIGFYARSSHDLIDVETCHIHCPLGETVYKEVRQILKNSQIVPYDPTTGLGELRHLLIKSAVNTREVLVILVTTAAQSKFLSQAANEIIRRCSSVKGVIRNINTSSDNVILGDRFEILEGTGFIHERICDMQFKVSPKSFFQVNPAQAEHLYAKALEFAGLKGEETVLDAYCGVGTMTLCFAKHAKEVIGVECVEEAIIDARENAVTNGISNVKFVCANAETWIHEITGIDIIVLNPPRKGCEVAFLDGLGKLKPRKVIYISCDPATLARDIAYLSQFGYEINAIQPYDMFPQTSHVESVVLLTLP